MGSSPKRDPLTEREIQLAQERMAQILGLCPRCAELLEQCACERKENGDEGIRVPDHREPDEGGA